MASYVRLWSETALGPDWYLSGDHMVFDRSTLRDTPSVNPVCALSPSRCIVTENAIGVFELEAVFPMDSDGTWKKIGMYMLISCMMPITPYNSDIYGFVTKQSGKSFKATISEQFFRIYKVTSNIKQHTLTVYASHISYDMAESLTYFSFYANQGSNVGAYYNGQSVREMVSNIGPAVSADTTSWMDWYGFPHAACYTQNVPVLFSSNQLIGGSEVDVINYMHYAGDMGFKSAYNIFFDESSSLLNHGWFDLASASAGSVTDEYGYQQYYWNGTAITDLRFMAIRNNHRVHIGLYDTSGANGYYGFNTGYEIRYGRNMQNLEWTIDASDVVTAIVPYKRKNETLYQSTTITTEDEYAGQQSYNVWSTTARTDVASQCNGLHVPANFSFSERAVVGHAGCWNYGSSIFSSEALRHGVRMRQLDCGDYLTNCEWNINNTGHNLWNDMMIERCMAQFKNKCDKPIVTVNVNFQFLGDTEEYRWMKNLEYVWLWSQVRVIYPEMNYNELLQVTQIKWNALTQRYDSVTLGNIFSQESDEITY